jgi:hypothetical protein
VNKPCTKQIDIYKHGDKLDMSNYRPISILTSFSKELEKLLYIRLSEHITKNNVSVNEQFGFRAGSSTVKATYKLLDEILTAVNSKALVGGIFCDLSKASDCVNHRIILQKLKFYGIVGKFHLLLESYLNMRYQKVALHNANNKMNISLSWEHVKSDVPRGSILGLLLFVLYINDLPKLASNNMSITLYADDTSVLVTNYDKDEYKKAMNRIFSDINEWFNSNILYLNY